MHIKPCRDGRTQSSSGNFCLFSCEKTSKSFSGLFQNSLGCKAEPMFTQCGTHLAVTLGEESCRGWRVVAAWDLQKKKPLDHLSLKMKCLLFTVHKRIARVLLYNYGPNLINTWLRKKKRKKKAFRSSRVLDKTLDLTVFLFSFPCFNLQV